MDNIRIINEDDYKLRFPNSNAQYFESLNEQQRSIYLKVLSLYYEWFSLYVNDLLGLKEYDNFLESENYKAVSEDNMDLYQKQSSKILKYMYIRNNIYVEKITNEELQFLRTRIQNKQFEYDEQAREFIEKTYKDIIIEDCVGKDVSTNYGPLSERFLIPNGTIVIGTRYDEYYQEENETKEEWTKKYNEKSNQLSFMIDLINAKFSQQSINAKIIKYDDFSIKKSMISDDKKL